MRNNPPIDLDVCKMNLLKYTVKAFRALPEMKRPRILDIGCGSGLPTMELARLSGGDITGIDIDRQALGKLSAMIKCARLADRVRAVHGSLFDMDFPEACFDVIWSEGAVFVLGFKKSLAA